MSDPGRSAWWDGYFDAHYLDAYAPLLPEEDSAAEAEALAELLGLGPGARVLDLGCGWGRHALELAERGCRVTAVDRSATLLDRGRKLAAERGVAVEWVQADIRDLERIGEYDAALLLFSTLGYSLRDEDDRAVLAAAARALTPDGVLVVETMHRDQLAATFAERDWWTAADGAHVWVEREFDPVAGVSREWLRIQRGDETVEKYHELRVRCATEWDALVRSAGLAPLAWYGDWDLSPLSHRSERLIVLAGAE